MPPRYPLSDEVHALYFDEGTGTSFVNRGSNGTAWAVEGSDWGRVTTGPFSLGEAYTGTRSNNARIRGPVTGEPSGSVAVLLRLKLTGSWPQAGYTHPVVKQAAASQVGQPGPVVGIETDPNGVPQFVTWRAGAGGPTGVAAGATIADGHTYVLLGTYDSATGAYALHIWDETLGAARTPVTGSSAGGAVDWKSHGPWLMGSWADFNENCPMELYELRVFPSTRDAAWLAAYVAHADPPPPVIIRPAEPIAFGSTRTALDEAFGVDIFGTPDLDPRFELVTGRRSLAQALARRLSTPKGGLFYAPDYGLDLRELVAEAFGPGDAERLGSRIAGELERDERVLAAAVEVAFDARTSRLRIAAQVSTAVGPFRLVLSADALSVQLLEVT